MECNKCFCNEIDVAVENIASQNFADVFPNPVQNIKEIKVQKPFSKIKVEIIDIKGCAIYKNEILENHKLNKNLTGLYIVKLQVDDEIFFKKILVN